MAVVSLWSIEGSVKQLIDYVENPKKTIDDKEFKDFINVIEYAENANKTKEKQYVTTINCSKTTAIKEMILTKKQFRKTDGRVAYHGYQSFKPDELTPKLCHEIGVKLAKEMWGDKYQVVVTTHLDKGHLHNHFAFNSVSFIDGMKYDYSNSEIRIFRETSDRLCKEYGLSIIEKPNKAPSRTTYIKEKSGDYTRYKIYYDDIEDAIFNSSGAKQLERFLIKRGYETDFKHGKYRIKLPQYKHFTNLETINKEWTNEFINNHTLSYEQRMYRKNGRIKMQPFYAPTPSYISYSKSIIWKSHTEPTSILVLIIYYLFNLGYDNNNFDSKKVSPYLKQDLKKLDEYSNMAIFLFNNKIETDVEIKDYITNAKEEMTIYEERRTKLQNKIRRADEPTKIELRAEKKQVTSIICDLRQNIKLSEKILDRSVKINDNLNCVYDNEMKIQKQMRDRDYER